MLRTQCDYLSLRRRFRSHPCPIRAVRIKPRWHSATNQSRLGYRCCVTRRADHPSSRSRGRELARRLGHRTTLAVPLMRDTTAIGVSWQLGGKSILLAISDISLSQQRAQLFGLLRRHFDRFYRVSECACPPSFHARQSRRTGRRCLGGSQRVVSVSDIRWGDCDSNFKPVALL